MIYCSGNIGINPETKALVEGSITNRTVSYLTPNFLMRDPGLLLTFGVALLVDPSPE
jgi:hypothetical protein